MKEREPITFTQFKKTIFYTKDYIQIPLLRVRLDKLDYMKKGVMNFAKIEGDLLTLYEKNKNRLK